MGDTKGLPLIIAAREPAGRQSWLNPEITRRGLFTGLAATSALLTSGWGTRAQTGDDWYDLEFSLHADGQAISIREVHVTPGTSGTAGPNGGQPEHTAQETRLVCACWEIPALAFGPIAYFDMERPRAEIGPSNDGVRTVVVREVQFGGLAHAFVNFRFTRSKRDRWKIAYESNLWVMSDGSPDSVLSSKAVPFEKFLSAQPLAGENNPYELIEGDRVQRSLLAIFDELIVNDGAARRQREPAFKVSIDKDLIWHIESESAARLLTHDGKAETRQLSFGWWRTLDSEDKGAAQESSKRSKSGTYGHEAGAKLLFAAFSIAACVIGDTLPLGATGGHRVEFTPSKAKQPLRLDVLAGRSMNHPIAGQCVSILSLGAGDLRIRASDGPIIDALPTDDLYLSQTYFRVPGDKPGDKAVGGWRSVLWDEPVASEPTKVEQAAHVRIKTPVGPIVIAKRAIVGEPHTPVAADQTVQASGTRGANQSAGTPPSNEEGVCPPSGLPLRPGPKEGESNSPHIASMSREESIQRLFAAAQGDKNGAPRASIYAVSDRSGNKAGERLRRFHADVALRSSDIALPDTSFSKLTFRDSELRFAFDDGLPLAALPFGERPRTLATSYVWVGPVAGVPDDRSCAVFDLSRAELECARDYDLMKLRFRFDDLALNLGWRERAAARQLIADIRPARDEFDVIVGDDGAVHDRRPLLIAEFDPQHVFEEAIFRPEQPPLPDVDSFVFESKNIESKEEVLKLLKGAADDKRLVLRKAIMAAKGIPRIGGTDASVAAAEAFKSFSAEFGRSSAGILPAEQQVYIGPYALDPDAMALARALHAEIGRASIASSIQSVLTRVDDSAVAGGQLNALGHIATPPESLFDALRNETVLESSEPLYAVFRAFWRDQITRFVSFRAQTPAEKAWEMLGYRGLSLDPPASVSEYLTLNNQTSEFRDAVSPANFAQLRETILGGFFDFAIGKEEPGLMGARLSGRSRLAFRLNGEPEPGSDAYDAGIDQTVVNSSEAPGAGNPRFKPIAFTFEALTDWSRHELSVVRRARKLFTAAPSGRLPPLGGRASNPSDTEILRFQGFSEGSLAGEQRMAEVRASLQSERLALTRTPVESAESSGEKRESETPHVTATQEQLHPFPGEPLDHETSIELPARLLLSTAQDAIWRTNRRMPPVVFLPAPNAAEPVGIPHESREPVLEEGIAPEDPCAPVSLSILPRDLWSVRLDVSVPPSLRAVSSPDLRLSALGRPTGPNGQRLPGQGAPPRGPLAPWFIGPEELESGRLTELTPGLDLKDPKRKKLLDWLLERIRSKNKLKAADDLSIFRTSLDAFDRHQIVLLTSAYGLPVIGKRVDNGTGEASEGGALITDSGQIEPGESFSLIDASADQAIYKPVPLNVKALSLTALGGSFLHETAFKPSAGADDLYGQKIFEGFSIESLQQDIVLGRDIRTEVVYKGYLLPLGHKASFVKLTERIFLRTKGYGIKAILRQRMFLRMSEPIKLYGAVGQPHMGRLWPAKVVQLISEKTPDILDPTSGGPPEPDKAAPNGRIDLDSGPGLAFWPRVDITESGLYHFPVSIDGAHTKLPMLFLDNIAATTSKSLMAAVEHYNKARGSEKLRTLSIGGAKIDFAPNSKSGEAQFETQDLRIYAHGRLGTPANKTWRHNLTEFTTTGVLEGAGQPPFYPALHFANIRIGAVERMAGTAAAEPVEVEYDGHYVRYGFTDDPPPHRIERPKEEDGSNPKNVFLNLRKVVELRMGGNGDRSGGMARPESNIVAISRDKGPLGGDETTWWQIDHTQKTGNPGTTPGVPGIRPMLEEFELVSMARYFNDKAARPDPLKVPKSPAIKLKARDTSSLTRDQQNEQNALAERRNKLLAQIKSAFSPSAKLLGTVELKDLMELMGIDVDTTPLLKETLEYGTAAAEKADNVAADVRARVLVPLNNIVSRLRKELTALDDKLKRKQSEIAGEKLTIKDLYPEIDQNLSNLDRSLSAAIATEDAISLAVALNDVKRDVDGMIRALRILSAHAIGRLEEAISKKIDSAISKLNGALNPEVDLLKLLPEAIQNIIEGKKDETAKLVAEWVVIELAPLIAPNEPPQPGAGATPQAASPGLVPDIESIAKVLNDGILATDIQTEIASVLQATRVKFASKDDPNNPLRQLIHDVVLSALNGEDIVTALTTGVPDKGPLLQIFAHQAIAVIRKSNDALFEKLKDLWGSGFDATALHAIVDQQLDAARQETVDNAINHYPVELQRLIASADFISRVLAAGRDVATAAHAKRPKDFLLAVGEVCHLLFGLDLISVSDEVKALEAAIRDGAQEAVTLAFGSGQWSDPTDNSLFGDPKILRDELAEVAEFTSSDSADIVTDARKGSNNLLSEIRAGIFLVRSVRPQIEKHAEKIEDIQESIDEYSNLKTVQLLEFLQDAVATIGDPARRDGLIGDLKFLYADLVLLVGAARDLEAQFSTEPDKLVDQANASARAMRRLGVSIGHRLRMIAIKLQSFVDRREQILVWGGGLALLSWPISYVLKALPQRDPNLEQLEAELKNLEQGFVGAAAMVLSAVFQFFSCCAVGGAAKVQSVQSAAAKALDFAKSKGISLEPEGNNLLVAIGNLQAHLSSVKPLSIPPGLSTVRDLFAVKVGETTLHQFLHPGPSLQVGAKTHLQKVLDESRALEAAVLREWERLRLRLEGAPEEIKTKALEWLLSTQSSEVVLEKLAGVYRELLAARDDVLSAAAGSSLLNIGNAQLIVPQSPGLPIDEAICKRDTPIELLGRDCDRLAQETAFLKLVSTEAQTNPKEWMGHLSVFFAGWSDGSAAPLKVLEQAQNVTKDVLRGNVIAYIDISAFRDAFEEAVSAIIPAKYSYSYNFNTFVQNPSADDAILQPQVGAQFGIAVEGALNLWTGKSDFSATAYIGPFQIYLIGGLVDAIRLKFSGAAFTAGQDRKPKLDVLYEDFEIGKDLEFAKQLQTFLTPKEGNGIFIQPMTRGAGIEAGYGINLGTISVGPISFFNVSLNVSAELPFDDGEALFKVSLGRRFSPFTISVAPYAGSGYFSIYAAADGVRGFEASFEFGGGGAVKFGPLDAQGRLQVGVFVRVLKVNGIRTTQIHGTFFAGGSASIWIFNFGCSLYVALCSSDDGSMYGEATFTFSFSIGLADYDYSVTAMHREAALGSGSGSKKSAALESNSSRTQYAQRGRFADKTQLASASAASVIDVAFSPEAQAATAATASTNPHDNGSFTRIKAMGPNESWATYLGYFDTEMVKGVVL